MPSITRAGQGFVSQFETNGAASPPSSSDQGLTLELRERERMKMQVLVRKANERTQMLQQSSRELLDSSKKLVSESKRRNEKAAQSLARLKAA